MSDVTLVTADELDYDAFVALQREAFAEVIARAGSSSDYMTPEFYRWKYHPPAGPAFIAVVRDGDDIIAANAMFPVDIRCGATTARGWQSCDTATAPRGRGKGYFTGCLRVLEGALQPDEIFFGFPNHNSMRGFAKLGWETRALVTTWVNPISLRADASDARIQRVDRFSQDHDELADAIGSGVAHVHRSAAYLNWRYVDHPAGHYQAFDYRDDHGLAGFVVVRAARAMSRDVTVVMEVWGARPGVERALLRRASAWAREQGTPLLVLLDTGLGLLEGGIAGFVPVPSRLLPKKQLFMGCVKQGGRQGAAAFAADWRVQTGDWDAF